MSSSASHRRISLALSSLSGVVLVGIILVLVNIAANWFFLRFDITGNHAYSLSTSSKRLSRSLHDRVVIKVYFTPDLPNPYNSYGRYVKDILAEYRSASRGKISYEFVPSQPAALFEQHAMEAGLAPLQFEEVGNSQFQVKRGFMGLVMFYQDKSEVLPVIKSIETLEYELTTRLARMSQAQKKTIGLTLGHGETDWRVPQVKFSQDLSQLFDFKIISLPLATTDLLQVDALLVVGPTQTFDEKSLWAMDQALMRGIPLGFLLDAKRVLLGQFMVSPQSTGLDDFLKSYGIKLSNQLVYDAQCATVGMTQNMNGFAFTSNVPYPFVPLVNHVDKTHPILRGIETIGLPFTSRVEAGPLPSAVRFQPLFYSSEQSWILPPTIYSVNPSNIPSPRRDDPHGPYSLGGIWEGTFPSYFATRSSPFAGAVGLQATTKSSIFVLGTSHIVDPSLPEFPGADAVMTNLLAYLAHDETILGIRSKGEIIRPLKPVKPSVQWAVKLASLLGLPLLPVVLGVLRWRRRAAWRQALTTSLGSSPK